MYENQFVLTFPKIMLEALHFQRIHTRIPFPSPSSETSSQIDLLNHCCGSSWYGLEEAAVIKRTGTEKYFKEKITPSFLQKLVVRKFIYLFLFYTHTQLCGSSKTKCFFCVREMQMSYLYMWILLRMRVYPHSVLFSLQGVISRLQLFLLNFGYRGRMSKINLRIRACSMSGMCMHFLKSLQATCTFTQ